jgi:hypothetical protein
MIGRRKRDGNHSPPKNNLIQDSEGNEENGYPVLDSNKTKINDTKEPNNVHKNTRNLVEFHGDETRHSYPKHTRCTQEISRHQK